jgi:uncharacterized protein YjbI with pentapeptide repeats
MINEEHLMILKQGVNIWNEWRKNNPQVIPIIGEVNLSNQNLSGINFVGVKLLRTNLDRSNLANADFSRASLFGTSCIQANFQNSYFENADLRFVNFSKSDFTNALLVKCDLFQVNLSNTILFQAGLSNTSFIFCDFYGANLRSTVLDNANISNSSFEKADLSQASLIGTTALKTYFKDAILTAACIQDWNINSQTNFTNIICNHVYLKHTIQQEAEYNNVLFTERRPHNNSFAPGEFVSLVQKGLETVDLIFSNGIDWQVFLASFQNLQIECGSDELAIQAIEKKSGDAFVIRVEAPFDADKAAIEKLFWQIYKPTLQAKDEQIASYRQEIEFKRQENTRLIGIIETMAEKETPKVNMNFYAPVTGVALNVEGNQNIYAPEQKRTLAEAAAEIQQLLKQLEESNPTATVEQQQAFVDVAVSPTLKAKFVSALQAGWKEAIKEFLDNPYVNVGVAILEGWQEAE